MILSQLSQTRTRLLRHLRGGFEAGLAPVTPRTSQGEWESFLGLPLGSTVLDECTFCPGTTTGTWEACIQLGVLSSVLALLPAHLKMELIYFSPFYNHAVSLSHAIFSTESTPAFPFSLPACVCLSLLRTQHHCGLEKCSRRRMCRKSFHVEMSSPNRIAASADLEWSRVATMHFFFFFLLDSFANVLCFFFFFY